MRAEIDALAKKYESGYKGEIQAYSDLKSLLSLLAQVEVLDTMADLPNLDGERAYAMVPAEVLARLLAGADSAVELLNGMMIMRNVAANQEVSGPVIKRAIRSAYLLESRARVAHGLQALPPFPNE